MLGCEIGSNLSLIPPNPDQHVHRNIFTSFSQLAICLEYLTTMGDFPCVHGPPYIPDRNGNCPLPTFMQNTNHSNVSCGQILCYDMGWNRGQDAGFVDQHCPAAVDTLPVSIDNTTIINREQVDAYCNGFIDGQQAVAEHPGVRSHVSSRSSSYRV
jgi:hypothetical protein